MLLEEITLSCLKCKNKSCLKCKISFTSVMVPVSVRVPVLVLELTVVLGHKSDLEGFNAMQIPLRSICLERNLLLERLDIAEAAKSSRQSSSTPSSSRQYTLLR